MTDVAKMQIVVDMKDNASKKLGTINKQFGKASGGITKSVGVIGAGISSMALPAVAAVAGIGLAVGKSVSVFASFEKAIANAASVTGATGKAFEDTKKNIEDVSNVLGATTVHSAADAANAFYDLASAGYDVANMVKSDLEPILNIASATQNDLSYTTGVITSTLGQFGLAIGDSGRVADVFAKTIGSSKATLSDLEYSMKYVGPVAKSMGMDIEQVNAILGNLYNAGFKGEQAGTALRGAFSRLLNPTSAVIDQLETMGVSMEDVNPATNDLADILDTLAAAGMDTSAAMKIFGIEAAPAMLALTESTPGIRELEAALYDAGGTAETMATQQLDTLSGAFALIKSAIESVMIAVGKAFAPMVSSIAGAISGVIPKIMEFVSSLKMKLTPAIEAARYIFENIKYAISEFYNALSGGASSALGVVVGIINSVAENVAMFSDILLQSLPNIINLAVAIKDKLVGAFTFIGGIITGTVIPALAKIGMFIASSVVPAMINLYTVVFDKLSAAFTFIAGIVSTHVIPALGKIASFLTGTVLPALLKFAGIVKDKLVAGFKILEGVALKYVIPALEKIASFIFGTVIPALISFWTYVGTKLSAGLKILGDIVSTYVIPALATIGSFIIGSVIPALISFAGAVKDKLVSAFLFIKDKIETIVLPALLSFGNYIISTILPKIKEFAGFIKDTVIPKLIEFGTIIKEKVLDSLRKFGDFIGEKILPKLQELGSYLKNKFGDAFDKFGDVVNNNIIPALSGLYDWLAVNIPIAFNAVVREAKIFYDKLVGWFSKLKEKLQPAIDSFEEIKDSLGEIFDDLAKAFGDDTASSNFELSIAGIGKILSDVLIVALDLAVLAINNFAETFAKLADWLAKHPEVIETVGKGYDLFASGIEIAMGIVVGAIQLVIDILQGDWESVHNTIKETANTVWDGIKTKISEVCDDMKTSITDFVTNSLGSITGWATDALGSITGWATERSWFHYRMGYRCFGIL